MFLCYYGLDKKARRLIVLNECVSFLDSAAKRRMIRPTRRVRVPGLQNVAPVGNRVRYPAYKGASLTENKL